MTLSEKESQLEAIKQKLLRVRDGMGMPIDAGIFDTVVALNALGFTTVQSCEGHADHGVCAPWVDISFSGADESQQKIVQAIKLRQEVMNNNPRRELSEAEKQKLEQAHVLEDEAEAPLFSEIGSLLELLTSFYMYRTSPLDHRLILHRYGGLRCRLESQVAVLQEESSPTKRDELLPQLQAEMQDLGRFAREKFLADAAEVD